jgi:phospholipid transport system substrate-binding protein
MKKSRVIIRMLPVTFAAALLCIPLVSAAQDVPAKDNKAAAAPSSPVTLIQESVTQILDIIKTADYKDAAKKPDLRGKIYSIVDSRFNWQEMSQRALGRYWKEQSKEKQEAFVGLFSQLLKKTYIDKVEGYSGQNIAYEAEPQDDSSSAVVKTTITQPSGATIPVVYRMMKKEQVWVVYDVVIEGVSLIKNYRSQFSDIMKSSSFDELLKKVEDKVKNGEKTEEKAKN